MKILILLLISLFIFSACEKGEIPIAAHENGDAQTASLPTTIYGNQTYFDFETNSFVSSNEKTDWDIAFGCGEFSAIIYVNTSKSSAIAKVENSTFEAVTNTSGLTFEFDSSTGFYDSLIISHWQPEDIFIIDLGYTQSGNHLGYRKLRLIENELNTCTFEYGNLNETNPKNITLAKDDTYNAIFYSLKNETTVTVEPPKTEWDIVFTQYIYYFHEFATPYSVTGVLMNRTNTKAYAVQNKSFLELAYESIDPNKFSFSLDAIGYEWKAFINNSYTIYPEHNFIIQTQEGFYYKLHFVDFYNKLGEKGFPVFEFQQL
ncbi:hypothetical protein DNU06_02335 [Putridiphycobacter roseus]|uniref:HmuY protein n=1 Tax=Putridiphycobacter roseus TaxID=2219161 RepID=A0A2W1N2Z5_9FLAO|nr:HmuY family protein [Putridiphycobacter roseus]PZE18687.1 hypothetical protein DNU06_02335 [Putridiphycobacter roseus]